MTITWSSFLILFTLLYHLGCERHDLHVVAFAQLPRDRAKDSGAPRVLFVAQNDGRIVVEADVGSIGAAVLLGGANDNRSNNVALLHGRTRLRKLDGGDDRVAHAG